VNNTRNNTTPIKNIFEKAVNVPMNFAILLRGDIDQLKKIADILESQNYAQVVFTDLSTEPLWIKRGTPPPNNDGTKKS